MGPFSPRCLFRRIVPPLVAGSLVLAGAGAAQAAPFVWATSSAPLNLTHYGSTAWGHGDWDIVQSGGTWSRGWPRIRINDVANHTAYASMTTLTNATVCVSPDFVTCSVPYSPWETRSTPRYGGSTWKKYTLSTNLPAVADYARASVVVRIDVPLRPDGTSPAGTTKGKKY